MTLTSQSHVNGREKLGKARRQASIMAFLRELNAALVVWVQFNLPFFQKTLKEVEIMA